MTQQYVKLIALPDTWFKEGTEVWHYDHPRRLTVEEWKEWLSCGFVLACGIRVCEDNPNENGMGCKPGEERLDGESCGCHEFLAEIVDEPGDFSALESGMR
jgi:hypothetical protein